MERAATLAEQFEAERPRLVGLAGRILGDHAEAQDVVQQAWLRLDRTEADIETLPAWLTTVTTRLCLDRLRTKTPEPTADPDLDELSPGLSPDPAEDLALAETVGVALQVVLDRLTPQERVAFVLHDTFGFEFATVATILGTTPGAARKLASRARAKVAPEQDRYESRPDWQVVDAFLAAARSGDFERLLTLLAPNAAIGADDFAIAAGTPRQILGQREVATFFNGAAAAALPVFVADRPGAAWFDRGTARVVFDFTVTDGRVQRIDFRAAPDVLTQVARRRDGAEHHPGRRS